MHFAEECLFFNNSCKLNNPYPLVRGLKHYCLINEKTHERVNRSDAKYYLLTERVIRHQEMVISWREHCFVIVNQD